MVIVLVLESTGGQGVRRSGPAPLRWPKPTPEVDPRSCRSIRRRPRPPRRAGQSYARTRRAPDEASMWMSLYVHVCCQVAHGPSCAARPTPAATGIEPAQPVLKMKANHPATPAWISRARWYLVVKINLNPADRDGLSRRARGRSSGGRRGPRGQRGAASWGANCSGSGRPRSKSVTPTSACRNRPPQGDETIERGRHPLSSVEQFSDWVRIDVEVLFTELEPLPACARKPPSRSGCRVRRRRR